MTKQPAMRSPPSMLSQEQALEFWFGRINYEQRVPQPADLKLDRMRTLLERLGDPQRRLRIIHVAGSKGKGSTSAMLAAILRRAGYRTGLFTSPHLCSVEERIQVDGAPISSEELTALLSEVCCAVGEPARHVASPALQPPLAPTFFEVATAVGFLHFVRRRVDVAVVEVGLGGRFDSTNVCVPEIAVITSISLDHTQQLGDRLASIAMEKAGIVKPGVPAVSGATAEEPRQVIERICRARRAPLQQLGIDFHYTYEPGKIAGRENGMLLSRPPRVQVRTRRRPFAAMPLGLLGEHQAANAAVAIACLEQLQTNGLHITDEALAWGLLNVSWPARLEVVQRWPLTVLDCAHNVASAEALVETLRASFPTGRRLLVFASSQDKDVAGIFRVLAPEFSHAFLTRYRSNSRSYPPQELGELLKRNSEVPFSLFPTALEAWRVARATAKPEDLICITGSVFLAGELRPVLVGEMTPESL